MYAIYDKKKNTVLVEMTPQELALQVVLNGSTSMIFVEEKHMNGNQNVSMDMLKSGKGCNKTGCYVKLKDVMEIVKTEGGYAK
ncbi:MULTISPECIES: hypothetical protein [Bacillus cereus group]|uniref:hypothetical protein n=1 Tax=Bacillus cereus group TaxID=86661 RepID=UPI000BEB74B0|nr:MULTISPECIES: hypothetical protein [Bacillus cereus group]PEF88549.1 hypothetical protein CON51_04925 [Bacillus thuringiensis]PES54726.1 hypothetical protein CN506_19725 [Bacillus thuringiensis]PFP03582.1 hypothetical protein COJ91_22595 [Bacillus thuringiensis]PFS55682.1 hypothetical protein COK64_23335 [Bacillus thuringiensis]PGL62334.1 hypothetical protein CN939_19500 [Bacillus thuringiensis]